MRKHQVCRENASICNIFQPWTIQTFFFKKKQQLSISTPDGRLILWAVSLCRIIVIKQKQHLPYAVADCAVLLDAEEVILALVLNIG